jgi:glucosyltransferase
MTTLPKVIIYQKGLLSYSETFIKEQILALNNWRAVLVGEQRISKGLPLDELEVLTLRPAGPIGRLAFFLCSWLAIPYPPALRLLRDLNAKLIHAHFGTSAVDIWPYARALGLPLIVTLHGYDINIHRSWWESGRGGVRRIRYPKQLLKLARESTVQFIAVSESIRKMAIAFGIPLERVSICYTGVNTKKFFPAGKPISERKKRILFIGRLVENKGVEYLIRALRLIKRTVPDAELAIVGRGPLHTELSALATSLSITVEFLGALTPAQVKAQLDIARVLCLPSITAKNGESEGFGMVLLEAQFSGVPVVTSALRLDTEGLINGVTGFKFSPKDIEDLAAKVAKILLDDQLASDMSSRSATLLSEKFDIANSIAQLEESYLTCLHTSG